MSGPYICTLCLSYDCVHSNFGSTSTLSGQQGGMFPASDQYARYQAILSQGMLNTAQNIENHINKSKQPNKKLLLLRK